MQQVDHLDLLGICGFGTLELQQESREFIRAESLNTRALFLCEGSKQPRCADVMEFWFPLHLQMCPWVGELVMADWNANAIHLSRLKATHLTKGRDHQGEDPFARTFILGQRKNLGNHRAIVVNSVRWKCSSKMSLQLSLQKDKSVRDRMATQGAAAG